MLMPSFREHFDCDAESAYVPPVFDVFRKVVRCVLLMKSLAFRRLMKETTGALVISDRLAQLMFWLLECEAGKAWCKPQII